MVINLTEVISINHNWGNSFNLHIMFDFLVSELDLVEKEIDDVKQMLFDNEIVDFKDQQSVINNSAYIEWFDICQKLLKANSGMNFHGFVEYLFVNANHLHAR